VAGEPGNSGESAHSREWEEQLAAAQQGDAAAYRDFLTSILPFVRAVARRYLRSDDAVEDAVQDSLLTLHRVRHTYQPGRPVKPWLAAIATRRAIDAGRRQGRIGAREVSDPTAYETFADPAANKEESAEAADSVARMMAELTPKQREALELVKLKEYSLAEASAASGQSVGSLKVNVHRAIGRLRRRSAEQSEP
jgi:RNA polymerase sigma-70 factor (ECF subfamily)